VRLDNLWEFICPLAFYLIEQALCDAAEDEAIGSFNYTIGLWVVDRGKNYLHPHTVAELSEELRIELFAIVYRDFSWDPKPANDILPKELSNCF
jgi:hypothetical protein